MGMVGQSNAIRYPMMLFEGMIENDPNPLDTTTTQISAPYLCYGCSFTKGKREHIFDSLLSCWDVV